MGLCTRVYSGRGYILACYTGLPLPKSTPMLFSTNASKRQAELNATALLIGDIPKFSYNPSFIINPLHWVPIRQRIGNVRSAPSWETILLALFHNTSRPTLSQYLLYLVVLPFALRLGTTWLSLGHEGLCLNLEVFLLWAHPTRTSYLSPLENFSLYCLISSASTWNLPVCQ